MSQLKQEELKLLRERNKYFEAVNLYIKKLRALELEKTAKLAKAKKAKIIQAVQKESKYINIKLIRIDRKKKELSNQCLEKEIALIIV